MVCATYPNGMGVNHGGTGEESSNNLEWGTLMQIVPTDFVNFQNLKHQIACITSSTMQ